MKTAILVAIVSSASAQEPRLPSIDLPSPLRQVLDDYESAWAAKDPVALAALFTEDGFVLSPGAPPAHGHRAIQKHYEGRGGPLALRALSYATEGSIGYVIGAYAREPNGSDVGKFTLTLRRQADGRWLIHSDMDNGN